jgi:hypothetical protein
MLRDSPSLHSNLRNSLETILPTQQLIWTSGPSLPTTQESDSVRITILSFLPSTHRAIAQRQLTVPTRPTL